MKIIVVASKIFG